MESGYEVIYSANRSNISLIVEKVASIDEKKEKLFISVQMTVAVVHKYEVE